MEKSNLRHENNLYVEGMHNNSKNENKAHRTLHKGIECVHCKRIFDCEGHIGELCVNFIEQTKLDTV